jgi:hypothetical protein
MVVQSDKLKTEIDSMRRIEIAFSRVDRPTQRRLVQWVVDNYQGETEPLDEPAG